MSQLSTIRDALHRGAARLHQARVDNPRLEARLLLAHACNMTVEALLRDWSIAIDTTQYDALLARRAAREPLALILGHREFWSLDFAVSPATLVPRPESETLIEAALDAFKDHPPPGRILDLGTGTGCLLLAALSEFPSAFGIGVDRSFDAACLAARNATSLRMADRAGFVCGDWTAALDGNFDLVLCNPPYVPTSAIDGLMPDVACYEPRSALDGGPGGDAAYRCLIPALRRLLTPAGVAVLELGHGQAETIARIAATVGFNPATCRDLIGIERALVLRGALP